MWKFITKDLAIVLVSLLVFYEMKMQQKEIENLKSYLGMKDNAEKGHFNNRRLDDESEWKQRLDDCIEGTEDGEQILINCDIIFNTRESDDDFPYSRKIFLAHKEYGNDNYEYVYTNTELVEFKLKDHPFEEPGYNDDTVIPGCPVGSSGVVITTDDDVGYYDDDENAPCILEGSTVIKVFTDELMMENKVHVNGDLSIIDGAFDVTRSDASEKLFSVGQSQTQRQSGGGVKINSPLDINGEDLVIRKGNLIINNGEGGTTTENVASDKPGTGNIIIGHNLDQHDHERHFPRSGSHNLIIGDYHTYTHNGGIVVGHENSIKNTHAIVLGGRDSLALEEESVVIGGQCTKNPFPHYTTVGGDCKAQMTKKAKKGGYGYGKHHTNRHRDDE